MKLGPVLAVFLVIGACSHPAPSQGPLSPEPRPVPARKTSSRTVESSSPQTEGSTEVEASPDFDTGDADPDQSCSRITASRVEPCLGRTLAQRACETWGPGLDRGVRAAWLSCLTRRSADPVAGCDARMIVDCGLRALERARVDGAHGARCAAIAHECTDLAPELTGEVCEKAIGAFLPVERPKVAECLEHGCRTGGFGSCIP